MNCSRHWESRYQLNLLAQEGGFEITGKRWQEWQVLQTCLLLISHIRTWRSWCTSSKFWLWIFFRLLQDQLQRAIEMIASEKQGHYIVCFIYCLHCTYKYSCVMKQMNHESPSFVVLQICLFCFCALKTVTSHNGGRAINMNVGGTHFLQHYYVLWFIRTFGWNVQCVIYSPSLSKVL